MDAGADDWSCVEHVFALRQLHLSISESGATSACVVCGAPAYDGLTPPSTRPKL